MTLFSVSMESLSPQEVILNGDSLAPTRVIEGVFQLVGPTTAKERLVRKNELKARSTLLMDLPDKHQLKFNTHKDAKTLMEAIEKSTNEPITDAASVSAVSVKIHVYAIPNVDTLSNDVICSFFASQSSSPQLDNDDLKQIDADDLEEMDLKWQMAILTVTARRFIQRTGRDLEVNGHTSMGFDMSKVECYNCHRKGHFVRDCSYDWSFQVDEEPTNYDLMAFTSLSSSSDNEVVSCSKDYTKAYDTLQSHYDKLTDDYRKSQFDVISYKTGLESVEARLLQNESVFEEDIKLLKLEVQLRDNALAVLRQNLEKAEQERDDLKLKLEKFQTFSKNLNELLASQTNDKTGLGYNSQVFTRVMFDCDDYLTSESDESLLPSPIYDRYQSGNGYHVVPPPYTGTFMPPKPDLVFHNAPHAVETVHTAFNDELSPTKPDNDLSHTHRPSAPIIEDWVFNSKDESETKLPQNVPSFVQLPEQVKFSRPSVQHFKTSIPTTNPKTAIVLTQSKLVFITAARPVTTAVPKITMTKSRQAKTVVTKPNSPPRRHINCSPSLKVSNFPPKVTAVKAPMVIAAKGNPQHALKDKGIIDSGCSRHMTGNMSYLFDFEKLNGGYVAIGSNPKGGKISGKGKIRTGKLDFDDVYFVKELKFNLFSISQMKHESEVNVSPSSSAQSKKHDDKTKREAKGKSPVESSIGYRNLSVEFEDFSDNNINEDNATGTLVPAVWQLFTDSTNTFSVVGPSNASVSPTHRKSSYVDSSQLFDDPNMPELECNTLNFQATLAEGSIGVTS
nr:hypothetical protein [Tanacetum cinerariifolium]